jgi:hypothetical protein
MNWKKIVEIVKQSFLDTDGKGSAKRFTLFACVVLLSFVVIGRTNYANATTMASILVGLVTALTGVTAYHSIKKNDKGEQRKDL